MREALVNTIVHTDYILSGIISIEKGNDYFEFENPGNLRVPFEVAKLGGESDQRNPIIHKIFSLVGLGERTGSGLNMIVNVWKQKGWTDPYLEEIAEIMQLKSNTIKKYLKNLKDNGIIYREGNNRNGKWLIAEDKEEYNK